MAAATKSTHWRNQTIDKFYVGRGDVPPVLAEDVLGLMVEKH